MNELTNVAQLRSIDPMRIGVTPSVSVRGKFAAWHPLALPLLGLAACSGANTPYSKAVACMRAYNQGIFPLSTGETLYGGDTHKSAADFGLLRSAVMSAAKAQGIAEADANKAISDTLASVANQMKDNAYQENDRLIREARTSLANCLHSN